VCVATNMQIQINVTLPYWGKLTQPPDWVQTWYI